MAGAGRALEEPADIAGCNPGLRLAIRVHLCRGRRENNGLRLRRGSEGCEGCHVRLECARIAVEVFLRAELQRVHEDTDDRDIRHLVGAPHQREVSLVQRSHGGHERDGAASVPVVVESRPQRSDGGDRLSHRTPPGTDATVPPARSPPPSAPAVPGPGRQPPYRYPPTTRSPVPRSRRRSWWRYRSLPRTPGDLLRQRAPAQRPSPPPGPARSVERAPEPSPRRRLPAVVPGRCWCR